GLVVRDQPVDKPHHFHIAGGLAFQTPAGLHTIEVAVNVKLQESRRVIGRSSSLLGYHTFKAHPMQIEGFHKRIDHINCVVLAYPIVQALRQKRQLGSIGAFDKTSHRTPPSNDGGIVTDSRVFTQPGSFSTFRTHQDIVWFTSATGSAERTQTLRYRAMADI